MIEQLTQTERLALCAAQSHEFSAEDDGPLCVTISRPSDGFRMPSRDAVRLHDARLSARDGYALPAYDDSAEDDESEDADDESALRDYALDKRRESMREHSFRLPSQGTRGNLRAELRGMGYAWND